MFFGCSSGVSYVSLGFLSNAFRILFEWRVYPPPIHLVSVLESWGASRVDHKLITRLSLGDPSDKVNNGATAILSPRILGPASPHRSGSFLAWNNPGDISYVLEKILKILSNKLCLKCKLLPRDDPTKIIFSMRGELISNIPGIF